MHDGSIQEGTPGHSIARYRAGRQFGSDSLAEATGGCDCPENIAFMNPDDSIATATESRGAIGHRLENRSQIGRRRGDHSQNVAGGSLLIQGRPECSIPLFQFLEEASILEGDHGLIGEGLEQSDLVIGEWFYL
jgi:hypothetical protein